MDVDSECKPQWLHAALCASRVFCVSDSVLPRLTDTKAAEAFIDSAEVVVIGFLEVRHKKEKQIQAMGSNQPLDVF